MKAKQSFHLLKNTLPWSTPSRMKFNLYRSTVLSILLFGSQVWLADLTLIKQIERFQVNCFGWIFGRNYSYADLLSKFSILPICHLIEYQTIALFLDLLSGKYSFEINKFVQPQTRGINKRRITSNPLKVVDESSPDVSSFFLRAVNNFNYLYRHEIIEMNDPYAKRKIKSFLLKKTFCLYDTCTYYISCYCSSCKFVVSIA